MDHVQEILALCVDGVIFFICLKQYLKNRRVVNELKAAPVYEISPELENIVRAQKDNRIPYAVVQGNVKAIGVPIDSGSVKGVTGVIQKRIFREHVVSKGAYGFWSDSRRIIQESNNSVPFVLVSESEGTKIEVLDAPTHAEMLDLTMISDKFQPTENSGVVEHVWGYFTGIRRRGIQTTEEMLKEGSLVTGVGEITLNTNGSSSSHPNVFDDIKYVVNVPLAADGTNRTSFISTEHAKNALDSSYQFLSNHAQSNSFNLESCSNVFEDDHPSLRLQQPSDGALPLIVSHLPLPSLITRLEAKRKAFGWATTVLGISGLILSCWIAYKWVNVMRIRMEREENRRARDLERREKRKQTRIVSESQPSSSRTPVDEYEDAQLCVICRVNPKELILLPCGHVCLCEDCLGSIRSKCPVCRADVQSVNVAYIS